MYVGFTNSNDIYLFKKNTFFYQRRTQAMEQSNNFNFVGFSFFF
jgi:hypothetical protein